MKGEILETLELLRKIAGSPGPSGYETTTREIIHALWEPLADEIRCDTLGNLIALQRGKSETPRPAIMGAAHMDEIALLVTGIEKGFLRIHAIGGIDRRILLGQEVIVHGKRELHGTIGMRPPHVLLPEERSTIPAWDKIFVDVGLPEAEVKQWVRIGDPITFTPPLSELKNKFVAGKAMDNRASVVALTLTMEILKHREHDWDFYAVATVQEEVGLTGAITGAYGINPQCAIAIDATFSTQYDDSGNGTFEINKGPTIGIGPNFHPQIVERLRDAANREEIPWQYEPASGCSGTDAWGIQVAREGIPTGLLSIPIRYMHQPVEMVALRDIERTARLLAHFVTDLEADYRPHWDDISEG
ncbi:MAG: M42 family metallopeptidase [Anaerolineae bacterium]|nr:M42 family metallopeptidase [Anaerolineae bacterium]